MRLAILAATALAVAGAAHAEVIEQSETAFRTRNVVEVRAAPARAYAALGEVGRWWNGAHSYSGDPANLKLPLTAGGCFCETWAGGSVEHGRVVLAWPAQGLLRIEAALGPLQAEGVSGAMTFEIKAKGDGVEVTQTYAVGGARPGFPKQVAAAVDQVVREQLARYAKYLETGKPD